MKKHHFLCLFTFVFFGTSICFAQQNVIDSLLTVLRNSKEDTNRVVTLNELSWEYLNLSAAPKADSVSQIALKLSNSLGYKKGIARSYKNIGYAYEDQGNYSEALKTQLEVLRIEIEIGEKKGIAIAYNSIGSIYIRLGNYSEALKNLTSALKIQLEIGNKRGIANAYLNIGNIYLFQGNYPETLKNYLAALKIREESGDEKGVAGSLINIGSIYVKLGNYKEALKDYLLSLEIYKKLGNKQDLTICYYSVGDIYRLQGNYVDAFNYASEGLKISQEIGDKYNVASSYYLIGYIYENQRNYNDALVNFNASLKIREEIGDKEGIASTLLKLGQIAVKLNKTSEASQNLIKALALSKEVGLKENIRDCYNSLATLDSLNSNWKEAFIHHKQFILYRDSISNIENTRKIVQSQMQYEIDKKDAIALKEKEKQKIITYSISAVLVLVLILAIFIFRGYRQKQKANLLLADKNKIIEEKNKNITDSINYAFRIQQAMLPKKEEILKSFPQSFVLFKPKSIVSGDFYFFHKNEHSLFIAAADCTGHGVPGALMSMLGSEKLNEAVSITNDTSEILKQLNRGIKASLRQTESRESTRDGMDIALCMVDAENSTLKFAGANRPIWIIRKNSNQVEELKATKKAIGGFTDENQIFDSQELKLQQGDTFYIFSDGYGDTFGGTNNIKLTIKRFRETLLNIQSKSMDEQEHFLDSFIEKWKDGRDQVDDILVIGVRL